MPNAKPLTAGVIKSRADRLFNSVTMLGYQKKILLYRSIVTGKKPGQVPTSMTRGGQVTSLHSLRILEVKNTLQAKILSYATYVTDVPYSLEGAVTKPLEAMADKVERAMAMARQRANEGNGPRMMDLEHMLIDPYAVRWQKRCEPGEDDGWSWEWENLDSIQCAFPEKINGRAYRPDRFAQRYEMLVADALEQYNDMDGPMKGKKLTGQGTADKPFRMVELGDVGSDRDGSATGSQSGSDDGDTAKCTFLRYADKDYIYHVLIGGRLPGGQTEQAEIVWYERNTMGGVPAVVMPGGINAAGHHGEKMVPFLVVLINRVQQLNTLTDIIATLAARDRPDVLVEMTPELFAAAQASGWAVPATQLQIDNGGPGMIAIGGKPTTFQVLPTPQLELIYHDIHDDVERIAAVYTTITDPNVIASATAQGIYTASSATDSQQLPLITRLDWADAAFLEMILTDIEEQDEGADDATQSTYKFIATQDIGGKVKQGHMVELSAADLMCNGKPFNHKLNVATVQQTEQQKRDAIDQMAKQVFEYEMNTIDDLIGIDTPDVTARLEALAEAKGAKLIGPTMDTVSLVRVREKMAQAPGGMIIPWSLLGMQDPLTAQPAPQQQGAPQQAPNDGNNPVEPAQGVPQAQQSFA